MKFIITSEQKNMLIRKINEAMSGDGSWSWGDWSQKKLKSDADRFGETPDLFELRDFLLAVVLRNLNGVTQSPGWVKGADALQREKDFTFAADLLEREVNRIKDEILLTRMAALEEKIEKMHVVISRLNIHQASDDATPRPRSKSLSFLK